MLVPSKPNFVRRNRGRNLDELAFLFLSSKLHFAPAALEGLWVQGKALSEFEAEPHSAQADKVQI